MAAASSVRYAAHTASGASAAAATLASMPLAKVLERDRPLAPWAAYRCALAAVLLVRENRGR